MLYINSFIFNNIYLFSKYKFIPKKWNPEFYVAIFILILLKYSTNVF